MRMKALHRKKNAFSKIFKNQGTLEEAGNVPAKETNVQMKEKADQFLRVFKKLAAVKVLYPTC